MIRHRLIAACVLVLGVARPAAAQGKLEVRYLNVGQADAILVTCPDGHHHLLIDSGDTRYPDSSRMFRDDMLAAFPAGQRRLDTVIASHPHQDHIGSMEWLLTNFQVDRYVDNGEKTDTAAFGRLDTLRKRLVKQGKLAYINGKQSSGDEVDFCPAVRVRLLEPWASDAKLTDTNDRSVAVRLDFKGTSFLFVGDIEGKAEDVMLNGVPKTERDLLDVDVLKVGHHGSDTSSSAAFLNVVTPRIAVISCGKKEVGTNARYKHPRASTVGRLTDLLMAAGTTDSIDVFNKDKNKWERAQRAHGKDSGLWVTTADGDVTITSDGTKLEVTHH